MKKLLTVVAALLLVACDPPAKPPETAAPPPPPAAAPPATAAPPKILTSGDTWPSTSHDTLRVRGGIISVQPATRAEWDRLRPAELPVRPDTLEARALATAAGQVRREGLRLLLEPANGGTIGMANDTTDGDTFVSYRYWGALAAARQWVLFVGLYEGSSVVLIDQRSGRRTHAWGRPVASPDGRYLLTHSADLEAAYDPNGLQLFKLEATGPRLLWEYSLDSWAPTEVRWQDKRTVLVAQEAGLNKEPGEPATGYVRLTLPAIP